MTATSDRVLLACHLAVRLSLESAAKSVVAHRGRSERGRYRGVAPIDLYRVLDPPASPHEVTQWGANFTYWWGLPAVLHDIGVSSSHTDLIVKACHEYVSVLMTSQNPHHLNVLRVWLAEVDRVAAEC